MQEKAARCGATVNLAIRDLGKSKTPSPECPFLGDPKKFLFLNDKIVTHGIFSDRHRVPAILCCFVIHLAQRVWGFLLPSFAFFMRLCVFSFLHWSYYVVRLPPQVAYSLLESSAALVVC